MASKWSLGSSPAPRHPYDPRFPLGPVWDNKNYLGTSQAWIEEDGDGATVLAFVLCGIPLKPISDPCLADRKIETTESVSGLGKDARRGVKRENSALMHFKSYQVDGHVLRTGAANFSASGLKRQDNNLIVINDTQAAAK